MKVFGWICVVIAALNFIAMFIALGNDSPDEAVGRFVSGPLMFGVLGGAFISMGNKKQRNQKDREKWNNT